MQPKRPNRRMRRKMGRQKGKGQIKPVSGKPNKQQIKKTPSPLTEEGILNKIRWLEHQRMELPKYPNIHVVRMFDALTGAIQIYYKKLENLRNPPKPKENKK